MLGWINNKAHPSISQQLALGETLMQKEHRTRREQGGMA
jgi:hypothetical protein